MEQMPECRRAFPRLAVDCEVTWRSCRGADVHMALARNISGGGMLLLASESPDTGARMEVMVEPGMLSIPALNAVIEVVWVESASWSGYGLGERPGPCFGIGARIVSMN